MGDQEIPLKASPSLLYQNLAYGEGKFVYLHKNEVQVLNPATKDTTSIQVKDKTYQANICQLNGQTVLVLGTQVGTQFWDLAKEKHLFTVGQPADEGSFLCRGICVSGSHVFLGQAVGTITVIEIKGDSGSVVKTLQDHKEALTDVVAGECGGQQIIVSADMAGVIIIRDPSGAATATIDAKKGDTVTGVCITPTHIVCGYGSGKIRMFSPAGKLIIEVAAHSRWINGIDYCAKTNTLASVSEDMLLQIWKMPSSADPKVALKTSKLLKDCLLTGVKFIDDGSRVGCTVYDTNKFFLFDC